METKARISIIQFVNGKKITFDEDRFTVLDMDTPTKYGIFVVLKNDPEKVIFHTKWDKVLYIRYGVFKKERPRKDEAAE